MQRIFGCAFTLFLLLNFFPANAEFDATRMITAEEVAHNCGQINQMLRSAGVDTGVPESKFLKVMKKGGANEMQLQVFLMNWHLGSTRAQTEGFTDGMYADEFKSDKGNEQIKQFKGLLETCATGKIK